jgi:putative spermidine/putrescine transport system permease protein
MIPMEEGKTVPRWINLYVGLAIVLVLLPIVVIIPVSFSTTASLSLPNEGLSFRWYQEVSATSRSSAHFC